MGIGRDLAAAAFIGGAVGSAPGRSKLRGAKERKANADLQVADLRAQIAQAQAGLAQAMHAQAEIERTEYANACARYDAAGRIGPPPGWYPDNADPRMLRFWDGFVWSVMAKPVR